MKAETVALMHTSLWKSVCIVQPEDNNTLHFLRFTSFHMRVVSVKQGHKKNPEFVKK